MSIFRGRRWSKGNFQAKVLQGTSSNPLTFTEGVPLVALYSTCASTDGSTSAESFYSKTAMTGAAGVGGRARFHLYTNVALGGWSNALKAYAEYGASGRTAGMGSALCAEMLLSAGTSSGTYAPLESEIVCNTNGLTGTATSFLYMNISGTAAATVNTNGYLFELGAAVVDTTDGLFDVISKVSGVDATAVLKIRIGGVDYFIPLNTTKALD